MSELVDHAGHARIVAEAYVPVSYCVCASDGIMADNITHIYSTKRVLDRCRGCVDTRLLCFHRCVAMPETDVMPVCCGAPI